MNFIIDWIFPKKNKSFSHKIREIIGYKPKNIDLYLSAFTHRSLAKFDAEGNPISYERLEFLGDSILSAVIASFLFTKMPNENEGYLTQMKSKIVSRETLNKIGMELGLKDLLKSKIPKKQFSSALLGDALESLIGALFIDLGYDIVEKFIHEKILTPFVDINNLKNKISSYKSYIIEYCQKEKKEVSFNILNDEVDYKHKLFSVRLSIDDIAISKGRGISKKKAEEQAAKRAYYSIQSKINKK